MKSFLGNLPAETIITDTAGLKFPPEILPPTRIAIASAAPMAKGFPVEIIT